MPKRFDWKQYYINVQIENITESQDVARTVKDLKETTRKMLPKQYDDWAAQNSVLPTMVGDPDFDGAYNSDATTLPDKNRQGNLGHCTEPDCWQSIDSPYYRYCKLCRKDKDYQARWGKVNPDYRKHIEAAFQGEAEPEVEDQGLAVASIHMMQGEEDEWSKVMDILYEEGKGNGSDS